MTINKVKYSSIILLLVWSMLFSIPVLSQRINNIILLLTETIITLWFMQTRIRRHVIKKYCFPIIALWLCFVTTTALNVGLGTRTLNAFVTGYKYVIFFYTMGYFVENNKYKNVFDEFYVLTFILVILSDIVVVISRGRGIGGNDVLGNFFIGNKFTVSYLHMLFLALFSLRKNSANRFKIISYNLLALYSMAICYIMECSTGVVGCLVMWMYTILEWKKTRLSHLLESPALFLMVLFGATFLLVGTNILLDNEYISSLFMKYSHTSKILSGRLDMYKIAILAIERNPWIGYGINCTIVEDILTWGNAQNGILKLLLDHGIIGTFVFSVVCFTSFQKKVKSNPQKHKVLMPFISMLYGLSICSMVEICLAGHFYFALAILNSFNHSEVKDVIS